MRALTLRKHYFPQPSICAPARNARPEFHRCADEPGRDCDAWDEGGPARRLLRLGPPPMSRVSIRRILCGGRGIPTISRSGAQWETRAINLRDSAGRELATSEEITALSLGAFGEKQSALAGEGVKGDRVSPHNLATPGFGSAEG